MADPSYINSQDINWDKFYQGMLPTAQPSYQAGMLGRGLPASMGQDRLPQGSAGLPNPSPGSGLTAAQLAAMAGWSVDPQTGQLAYSNGSANPAVAAAAGQAAGYPTVQNYGATASVPLPRARPPWAPTSIDMAAINGQQGANPGMGGALIGNGQMAPGIAPQGPPPAGIAPTVWAGSNGSSTPTPPAAPITQGTDGYTYQNGKVVGLTDWAQRGRQQGLGPAGQYAAANLAGQLKAQMRGEQARAAGQTTLIDKLRAQGMSPSDAYASANSHAQQTAQASAGQGTTSWGGSKVGPGGESWAAGPHSSGSGGGGDSLLSSKKPRKATNDEMFKRNMVWHG
jgi:hypothetical protein